jgi:hypothetical protein
VTDEGIIQRYFARFDENFFQFCDKELAKINTFFYGELCYLLQHNKIKLQYQYGVKFKTSTLNPKGR